MRRISIIIAMVVPAMILGGGSASAGNIDCTGVLTGPVNDNVRVPSGALCDIDGAVVNGNVHVEPGGELRIRGASVIRKNVHATGARSIRISGRATIEGNAHFQGTFGSPSDDPVEPNYICDGSRIMKNLHISDTTAPRGWDIGHPETSGGECDSGNTVDGQLQVMNNQASVRISFNTIGKHLQCHNNTPPATGVPGSNTAEKKQGECTAL